MKETMKKFNYCNIHRKIYEVEKSGLETLLGKTTDEFERECISNEIDNCNDWISHYMEMIDKMKC